MTRPRTAALAAEITRYWTVEDEDESPLVGVPDLEGVRRAFRNGSGIRRVMDVWALDYQTAKAIRDELTSGDRLEHRRNTRRHLPPVRHRTLEKQ